jgi:hypothetical protein
MDFGSQHKEYLRSNEKSSNSVVSNKQSMQSVSPFKHERDWCAVNEWYNMQDTKLC